MKAKVLLVALAVAVVCVVAGYFWMTSPPRRPTQAKAAFEVRLRPERIQQSAREASGLKGVTVQADVESGQGAAVRIFGVDGILTFQAIKAWGLSMDEALRVQSEIDQLDETLSAIARSHTEEVLPESDEPDQPSYFRIRPYDSEARKVYKEFSDGINKLLGDSRSEEMLKAFAKQFSDRGRYEIAVEIEDLANDREFEDRREDPTAYIAIQMKYKLIDPNSGDVVDERYTNYDGFEASFGSIFAVEPADGVDSHEASEGEK